MKNEVVTGITYKKLSPENEYDENTLNCKICL